MWVDYLHVERVLQMRMTVKREPGKSVKDLAFVVVAVSGIVTTIDRMTLPDGLKMMRMMKKMIVKTVVSSSLAHLRMEEEVW